MNNELEDLLKSFTVTPGSRVKKAVMTRFAATSEPGKEHEKKPVFWLRPIPIYVLLALLVVAVGISFMAGRSITRAGGDARILTGAPEDPLGNNGDEITWVVTSADFI